MCLKKTSNASKAQTHALTLGLSSDHEESFVISQQRPGQLNSLPNKSALQFGVSLYFSYFVLWEYTCSFNTFNI